MILSRHRTLALTAAAALLAAGCSNTSAATAPSLTFAPDIGSTPGMPAMSSMPGMPAVTGPVAPVDAPAPPQGPNAISINNFAFTPATLTVPVGATVTWTNHDEEPHTVVAGDGTFHSPGMGTGGTYTFTFMNVGSFDYVCSIHPFMHGAVVVTK